MENKEQKPQENSDEKKIAFYDRLKEELEKNSEWPAKYMYKFIMPNKEENIQKAAERFGKRPEELKTNFSKNGKYVSVTIVEEEKNPESVINRYKSMEDIEGLVAL